MLKNKKTKYLFIVLTIMVCFLAIYEAKSMIELKEKSKLTVKKDNKIGPYTVFEDKTAYEKELTPLLEDAISKKDEKQIQTLVSQYFVAEYFTLRDKSNYSQVGGVGFVLPVSQSVFKTNAIDSYYRDIKEFIVTYGQDNLPLVTEVKVNTIKKGKVDDIVLPKTKKGEKETKISSVVKVNCSWTYEANDKLSTTDVVDKMNIVLVKASDNWYVYELESVE
ncbi:MAG: hypothetical protein LBR40_04890 [Bacilli bacterium]|jgi:hypothetical protein|nr:hypothetical protein [Bacilli bacterium]